MASRRKQVAETEINDFDVASFTNEDVFDFQIAMDDAVSVTVVQSTGNLTTKLAGLLLLELAMRNNVVEHLAAVDILKEHIPMIVCANHISHAADVGVMEKGDNGSLASGSDLL